MTESQQKNRLFDRWHQILNKMETLYMASGHPWASRKADSIISARDHLRDYESWFQNQAEVLDETEN